MFEWWDSPLVGMAVIPDLCGCSQLGLQHKDRIQNTLSSCCLCPSLRPRLQWPDVTASLCWGWLSPPSGGSGDSRPRGPCLGSVNQEWQIITFIKKITDNFLRQVSSISHSLHFVKYIFWWQEMKTAFSWFFFHFHRIWKLKLYEE